MDSVSEVSLSRWKGLCDVPSLVSTSSIDGHRKGSDLDFLTAHSPLHRSIRSIPIDCRDETSIGIFSAVVIPRGFKLGLTPTHDSAGQTASAGREHRPNGRAVNQSWHFKDTVFGLEECGSDPCVLASFQVHDSLKEPWSVASLHEAVLPDIAKTNSTTSFSGFAGSQYEGDKHRGT